VSTHPRAAAALGATVLVRVCGARRRQRSALVLLFVGSGAVVHASSAERTEHPALRRAGIAGRVVQLRRQRRGAHNLLAHRRELGARRRHRRKLRRRRQKLQRARVSPCQVVRCDCVRTSSAESSA